LESNDRCLQQQQHGTHFLAHWLAALVIAMVIYNLIQLFGNSQRLTVHALSW
jgi:hypothetical protein